MTLREREARQEIANISFAEIKLENEREDRICTPLNLWDGRNTAMGYADVSWESSDPETVSLSGEVHGGKEAKRVALTAVFTYQDFPDVRITRQFQVCVLPGGGQAVAPAAEPKRRNADTVAVFIVGDSTASAYPHSGENNRYPQTGWGQMLQRYFDEDRVLVVNYAMSGRSSKSFRSEDNYRRLKHNMRRGDYLIIQFGHNDSKIEDPKRYTGVEGGREEEGSYQHSLMQFITLARQKGGHPVLATSISRLSVRDESLERYVDAVRELGKLEKLPVLDLYAKTNRWIREVGLENARAMYKIILPHDSRFAKNPEFLKSQYLDGDEDLTHLNIFGADLVAQWACETLVQEVPGLGTLASDYRAAYPLPALYE